MLSGLDKQPLVKLGDLDTNVPNVVTIGLAVCCKAPSLPAAMLAGFEDVRSRPNSMTVLAFPDHSNLLDPYAQPSLNSMHLHATKACTYLTLGHMFSNDKDKAVMRIHKVVFSTESCVFAALL